MTMMPGQQNGPRVESYGPSLDSSSVPDSTAPTTACEHFERARYWTDMAERQWLQDSGLCQSAAKLAALHIMLADRADDLNSCAGLEDFGG